MYRFYIKSLIDILISLIIFVIVLPVLIIVTLLLFFANQGKPFFIQLRPGKNGELFKIIKFKTMNDKKDSNGKLLPDVDRLTKIGKLVRKSSIDEIPKLFNFLRGEMSLIGPRPLLPEYLPLYDQFQKRRHEVKPGITGWGKVNGRNTISWQQKFEYDVWYVENRSFLLDCKIVYLTIKKVFKSEGITADNSVSAEVFKGN